MIRSYRLVFRRRWRIFRLQGWRIPLPGGLELRALAYWLVSLLLSAALARLPLFSLLFARVPVALRLVAMPLAAAWLLSRWEVDGRAPHRALLGFAGWRLAARSLCCLRRCPPPGAEASVPAAVSVGPDRYGARYPRGRLRGPARVLLRYPVEVRLERVPAGTPARREARISAARRWRLRQAAGAGLHRGRTLSVPPGKEVIFE